MKIGYIGLGRMGANMVELLLEKGHSVVGFDVNNEAVKSVSEKGAKGASSIEELVEKLEEPRLVWIMVPRAFVQNVLDELVPLLNEGDTIIEGGNTYFEDSIKRAEEIEKQGINYIDVGVSGGMERARTGACMMIGGKRELFDAYESLFDDLTVENGYGYMGSSGAGHYVKMVHNGIEYGMMSAIAEGMNAIRENKERFGTDLSEVIKAYSHGSIIESSLVDWLDSAWKKDNDLSSIPSEVPYGETEEEMEQLEENSSMPTLQSARLARVSTRDGKESFAGKVINALRFEFGGHKSKKDGDS